MLVSLSIPRLEFTKLTPLWRGIVDAATSERATTLLIWSLNMIREKCNSMHGACPTSFRIHTLYHTCPFGIANVDFKEFLAGSTPSMTSLDG